MGHLREKAFRKTGATGPFNKGEIYRNSLIVWYIFYYGNEDNKSNLYAAVGVPAVYGI